MDAAAFPCTDSGQMSVVRTGHGVESEQSCAVLILPPFGPAAYFFVLIP